MSAQRCPTALALLLVWMAVPAQGLIISNPSAITSVAPADDPGWENVGSRSGSASAVYLGQRWVLSANHVGAGPVTFDGRTYAAEAGTERQLSNPGGQGLSSFTDLVLFRLESEPGLPPQRIREASVPVNGQVTMIGFGRTRQQDITYWDIEWNEVDGPRGSVFSGFKHGDAAKRWGTNRITEVGPLLGEDNDALALRTTFDSTTATPYEAQAWFGDSGGGVFYKNGQQWELAGIMTSITTFRDNGQPERFAVFGNRSNFADLSRYRDQIVPVITATPWRNLIDPYDVNDDESLFPSDALAVINEINARRFSDARTSSLPLNMPGAGNPLFYDVNGDNFVTPLDALIVINRINKSSNVSARAAPLLTADSLIVPEPGGRQLVGCLLFLAAVWRACRLRSGAGATRGSLLPRPVSNRLQDDDAGHIWTRVPGTRPARAPRAPRRERTDSRRVGVGPGAS